MSTKILESLSGVAKADVTLDLLLQSLSSAYSKDGSKPGVLVSYVNKGKTVYYASILRFPNGPTSKTVLTSATGKNREEAITSLATKWLDSQSRNPIEILRGILERDVQ